MFLLRRVAIIFSLALFALLPIEAEAALQAKQLRYSDTVDKTRIVVDVNEEVKLEKQSGFGNRIEVLLGKGDLDKGIKDIVFTDKAVRQVKLFKVNKDQLLLDIWLNEELNYTVFVLPGPWRVVIDIEKEYFIKDEQEIAPGLVYTNTKQSVKGRKLKTHALTIDTNKWDVKPVLAKGEMLGRDKLKSIVSSTGAKAAVNASYFGGDGWIIGNLKIDGEILGMENMHRTAMVFYPDRKMEFSLLNYEGEVILPGGVALPIKGINRTRTTNDLVLYESRYVRTSETNEHGCDVLIDKEGNILQVNPFGNTQLQDGHFIVSGHGLMADHLNLLRVGDKLTLTQTMGEKGDKALHVLGAGPRLLQAKQVVVANNNESFLPDITNGRAPRTAVGIDSAGKVVLFVVDGRSKESIGMTLTELAYELLHMGIVDAMNLDGGGSTEMVIGEQIVNSPSDKQERRISVALGVFPL